MHHAELTAAAETVSRTYAARHGIDRTDDWLVLKLTEEVGELTQSYLARCGQTRHTATDEELDARFRAELADVLAQVLLIASRFGVDLQQEVADKWHVHLDAAADATDRAT